MMGRGPSCGLVGGGGGGGFCSVCDFCEGREWPKACVDNRDGEEEVLQLCVGGEGKALRKINQYCSP
jgi:hypothetical protein